MKPELVPNSPVFISFTPRAFSRMGRKSMFGFSQKSISPLTSADIAVCGSEIHKSSTRSTPANLDPAKNDARSLPGRDT